MEYWRARARLRGEVQSLGQRSERVRVSFYGAVFAVALVLVGLPLHARGQQGVVVPSAPGNPYTLHVYEDLVQVPSLVMTSLHASYRGLGPENFRISLDSGPEFHPNHIRLEGDDPIQLVVLLDATPGERNELLQGFDAAVSRLPLDAFTQHDRVSVYAFGCKMVRSVRDKPALPSTIQAGVSSVLSSKLLDDPSAGAVACSSRINLWDAIASTVQDIHGLPGRRILLAVTDGRDRGSTHSWESVRQFADAYSVAVFGVRPPPQPLDRTEGQGKPQGLFVRGEDPFAMLCGGTGGTNLRSSKATLEGALAKVIELVRKRYILDFPRPANGTPGIHEIVVRTTDPTAIVASSGVSVPLPDPTLTNDPSTVPRDTSHAPVLGTRRVLQPEH